MAWLASSSSLVTRSGSPPTAAQRLEKADQQRKYVRELWLFLTAVIALLACVRFARLLLSRWVKPTAHRQTSTTEKGGADVESGQARRDGRVSLRRLPAATASAFRIVAFRWTVPIGLSSVASVSELTFIIGYIVAIFVWLFVDTEDLSTMFYEDRAAHFASCQLPLIVVLAGKNNIISFLTGIGHEKLNVLHRAAARTCLILLWMHAICRSVGGLPAHFDFTNGWMVWGATGLTAFSLATALSIRPVRQVAFEFFLVSHIILVGIFMVGGYLHARDPGFGDYIWPALVLWAFDRVLRTCRLLYNNRVWSRANDQHSKATVELLSEDTVRLTLRRRFSWKAGQHAYVILPSVSNLPTEAHPFTIASIPGNLDGSEGPEDKDVVFLIRGRTGFTGRLRDHARSGKPGDVTALVDGPYGSPPDLTSFSTCILIAGGSGVSYTLPLLLDLVHNARAGRSAVRRVVFVWSVRDGAHLAWIAKLLSEALAAAPSSLVVEPRVYITGASFPIAEMPSVGYDKAAPEASQDKMDKLDLPVYSALKLLHGRPSIRKIFQDEFCIAAGPVSVDVAGPSALSQSVRTLLHSELASPLAVLKGAPSVTLHVETFGMVKG
ncbi:hypothetical protein PLICRDRAFT_169410 [Plicaturopsis crispa FD-325 SS-3]|nr:hypothetical protein PLICRDRAFT_169410 [Plicaturopsis crispa FD-325 SS-3]